LLIVISKLRGWNAYIRCEGYRTVQRATRTDIADIRCEDTEHDETSFFVCFDWEQKLRCEIEEIPILTPWWISLR